MYGRPHPAHPRREMDDVTANLLRPRKKNRAIIVWWRRGGFLGLGHLPREDGQGQRATGKGEEGRGGRGRLGRSWGGLGDQVNGGFSEINAPRNLLQIVEV